MVPADLVVPDQVVPDQVVPDKKVRPGGRRPPSVFTSRSRRPPSIIDGRRPPSIIDDLERIGSGSGSDDPDLVDAVRAAEILAIAAERLEDLIRTHRITYYERGSTVLFDPEDLEAWRRKEPNQYRPRRSRLGR